MAKQKVGNKVRKGEMIAVSVRSSYNLASMHRVETCDWILAVVNTAGRDGLCRTFIKRSGTVETVGRDHAVWTISADRQEDARRLFKSLSWDEATWPSGEALRQSIREADTREVTAPQDVSTVTEYGLTQKLSNAIRVY